MSFYNNLPSTGWHSRDLSHEPEIKYFTWPSASRTSPEERTNNYNNYNMQHVLCADSLRSLNFQKGKFSAYTIQGTNPSADLVPVYWFSPFTAKGEFD